MTNRAPAGERVAHTSPDGHHPLSGEALSWMADDLSRVEKVLTEAAESSAHPLVSESALHLIKAGGKRLRPALVLLASHAGEPGRRSTDLAAAAVELVHIATLYHDDVLDQTDMRRGVPTAHSKWGVNVAVLAGDYLFALGCGLSAEASGEAPGIIARAIGQVCEGQIAEMASLDDPSCSLDAYLETIRRKTAALFRGACQLGTATGGADEVAQRSLCSYGENLGMAFQVVDDVLDLVGDPRLTGKAAGSDLREGVFTMPVLLACARNASVMSRVAAGERDVDRLLPAVVETGAITDSLGAASSFGQAALDALADVPESRWRDGLRTVVERVLSQIPHNASG